MLLSASTVFALLGLALVIIAGISDNWLEYQVGRKEILNTINANRNSETGHRTKELMTKDPLYFSRNYGLVHVCFPDNVPSEIGSFSKFGSPCVVNPDYFPEGAVRERYSSLQTQRLWYLRASVFFYLIGLIVIALCLLVGIVGCYKRSASVTRATAIFLFFAVLFLLISISLWHYVNYMERRMLDMPPFFRSWDSFLKQHTRISFGWSYIVAWVGIGFLLFAAIFLLLSWRAIKTEEERVYEGKHAAYFQQYYDKSLVPVSSYGPYGGGGGGYASGYPYYGQQQFYPSNYYGYMTYGH